MTGSGQITSQQLYIHISETDSHQVQLLQAQ